MKTSTKWVLVGLLIGFSVAWIAQEFRMGHAENVEAARRIQTINETHSRLGK